MKKSIQHTWFFPQAPKAVWDYLTKAELLEQWLMKNDFEPVLGHRFQFITSAMPAYNFDGIINCEVLEISPFTKLCYSWKGGPAPGEVTLDSIVTWTLEKKDKGTQLTLLHAGFRLPEDMHMFTIMDIGWNKNVLKIAERITHINNDNTII